MIKGFFILVVCQLVGEALSYFCALPIPGAILGMLVLLVFLMVSGGVSRELNKAATNLFPFLPLFLIPTSVGVMVLLPTLGDELWAIVLALTTSTVISFLVTPWLMLRLKRAMNHRHEH